MSECDCGLVGTCVDCSTRPIRGALAAAERQRNELLARAESAERARDEAVPCVILLYGLVDLDAVESIPGLQEKIDALLASEEGGRGEL